jgi:hypothetical protein
MNRQLLCLLGVLSAVDLAGGCARAPHEEMVIERQVKLSPEHYPKPSGIIKVSDGDFVVFGVTGRGVATDYRPWATRVSPSGEMRWEYLQERTSFDRGFYGAIELKDQTILMCGAIDVNRETTVVLDHLRADGTLIEEQLIHPTTDGAGRLGQFNCAPWEDGMALAGGIIFGPTPTAWLAKVNGRLRVELEKFNPEYRPGELVQSSEGGLFMLSWSDAAHFILKLGRSGSVLARHALPQGENHLVQRGGANRAGVGVVSLFPSFKTELLQFDDQLLQTNSVTLHNVGLQKAIELSDGTIEIFGSEFHNGPTAAVTRIYTNGSYRTFLLQPPYRSPWYSAAVPTETTNEIAATRELVDGGTIQLVLDWIVFR